MEETGGKSWNVVLEFASFKLSGIFNHSFILYNITNNEKSIYIKNVVRSPRY